MQGLELYLSIILSAMHAAFPPGVSQNLIVLIVIVTVTVTPAAGLSTIYLAAALLLQYSCT